MDCQKPLAPAGTRKLWRWQGDIEIYRDNGRKTQNYTELINRYKIILIVSLENHKLVARSKVIAK